MNTDQYAFVRLLDTIALFGGLALFGFICAVLVFWVWVSVKRKGERE